MSRTISASANASFFVGITKSSSTRQTKLLASKLEISANHERFDQSDLLGLDDMSGNLPMDCGSVAQAENIASVE